MVGIPDGLGAMLNGQAGDADGQRAAGQTFSLI